MVRDDRQFQGGAALAEFVVIAPALLLLGLGLVQTILLYQGKTVLNQAAFEAARVGAVEHASVEAMTDELAYRLSPLAGGDGSAEGVTRAVASSMLRRRTHPLHASIEVISPGADAFDDWGRADPDSGEIGIPNSHLRHRGTAAGAKSGLSIQDANLLIVDATHGYRLRVPLVSSALLTAMTAIDPEHAAYYRQGLLPLTSRATVRMQSEAWKDAALPAESPVFAAAPGGEGGALAPGPGQLLAGPSVGGETGSGGGTLTGGGAACDPLTGLPIDMPVLMASPVPDGECTESGMAVAAQGHDAPRDYALAAGC